MRGFSDFDTSCRGLDMRVKDAIEVNDRYLIEHHPGLVVILDALVAKDPQMLVGMTASIHTPAGDDLELLIDEAKEHGPCNSLFFKNVSRDEIPLGSEIAIAVVPKAKSMEKVGS